MVSGPDVPSRNRITVAYFVSPSSHYAGIERVVHEVATGLAEAFGDELEVHVLYCTDFAEEVLRAPAYTKHVLGVDRLRRLAPAIRRALARIEPDVLVVPQVEAAVTVWAATRGLPAAARTAFVLHLHGNPRVEEDCGPVRSRVAFSVFRWLVRRRTALVLAVSPSLAAAAAAGIARGRLVRYVPNPVRGFGSAIAEPAEDGVLKLICVARLSQQKGQDLLLEGLALARSDLPPVQLTLVGGGDAEPALRRQVERLGLTDVVHFTGYTTDPLPHLVDADVFVLASRWEGFGVALVEALGLGLPLLATDCEFGPADIVTSPQIGELVAPEDPAAIAAGLRTLAARATALNDPAAVRARRSVAAQHARSEVTMSHLLALREAFAQRPARRRERAATPPRGEAS